MIRKPNLRLLSFILMLSSLPSVLFAQKVASVTGKYTYVVSENDNVTLKEAKIKCVEQARAEAIKSEFGTLVTSDVMTSERVVNEASSSFFLLDTATSAKGEWLADEKDPVITVEYDGQNILFTAQVWGKAREIVRANTELRWNTFKRIEGADIDTEEFDSGERIFVKFKTPSDGYVAIYLITGDEQTACLLPYPKDPLGRVAVKKGREYVFFDKSRDVNASYYKLSTDMLQEYNQLVVVYSPNSFSKCVEESTGSKKINTLNQKDFAKWLLKQQRSDKDMVVQRKWLSIKGKE